MKWIFRSERRYFFSSKRSSNDFIKSLYFTFLMKFLPSRKILIIYLEKFELFVWLFLSNLFFPIIHYTWFRKGWNTSIDINMIYINKIWWWWFRYIYFVTNFIHAWTLFPISDEKKKITSREIYVTFENNFENISQWEKKDKIKYLKEAMQM